MNLFEKFSQHFGSVENAIGYLSMMGYSVNKGRFMEWSGGKRLPRGEVLNIILTTVTRGEITLNPVEQVVKKSAFDDTIILNRTVTVDTLRSRLPQRRFSDNYFKQLRLVDREVEEVIYGYNVWERFKEKCGGLFKTVDVLRNAGLNRRITESWVLNRIDSGWYPDVLNYMDEVVTNGLPQVVDTVRSVSHKDIVIRYGFDVWKRFKEMCGNFNNAMYVLRRNNPNHNITENWLLNHVMKNWPSDVLDIMVDLLERYEGTDTPFNAMGQVATVQTENTPSAITEIREYVRQFAMMANPQCDYDAIPDDVIMQLYKDMQS